MLYHFDNALGVKLNMNRNEKRMALFICLVILGSVAYLLLFVPIGSLGSADGQSFDIDRFSIIGFLILCLIGGYFLMRQQNKRQ